MTFKEAFSQAFDEAFVMDALPSMGIGEKAPNPAASGIQKNPAKAASMGGASSSGTGGSGEMMTLAEHDEKNHPGGYKGGKCTWRDSHGMRGMTLEEAQRKGLADKKFPVGGGEGEPMEGGQPQEPTPEMIAQQTQQIAENPQMMEQVQSEMLPETKMVQTEVGELPAQTTVQEGILENLAEQAASGNTIAEQSLQELKDKVDDGTITQGGEQQSSEQLAEQPNSGELGQTETPLQEAITMQTSDGKKTFELTPEAVALLQVNPEKKEILQQIIDLDAKAEEAKTPAEKADIEKQIAQLDIMLTGNEETAIPSEEGAETGQPLDVQQAYEAAGNPPNNPPSGQPTKPMETVETTEEEYEEEPAPSDEQFRLKNGKYKIGDVTYTDVSKKGLLGIAVQAFLAGMRGEGIITSWDRISGTWDQMKRSAAGENVRDGIKQALSNLGIEEYAKKVTNPVAKGKLDVIIEMFQNAKTPAQKMAAYNAFEKWKEKYKEEIDAMKASKPGTVFEPLPNDYKGGKPPISILDAPKDFEADKAFGDKVASVLQESLGAQGLPVGDIESINVGPSATTIEFKVDPTFNITEAKSKKVLETLHGALGSPVSNVSWVDGKPHVIAVQVTNQKMRDVSFSACIASDEWKNFAEKAGLPVTLGKDSSGKNVNLDLAKQPHTIVTGESGSGKSVFLMAAINSLEMAKTPDEARLVLLDPKNEFRSQDGSPHLLYPRAQKPQDIANVVSSLKALMDDRIAKIGGVVKDFDPTKNEFQGNSDRNITEYNKLHPEEKMPHVLLTFDEVASIMKNPDVADRVKQDLSQIMALGRSVGINCLLATQRADVASIPGDIKANAPASIAFKAAPDDAKASAAAKSLAGSGDFIMTDKEGKQTRGRGCFISDKEVAAVPAYYRDNMKGAPSPTDGGGDSGAGEGKQLPQEHLDAIAAAVEKGNPISMVATEGFMDAFKNAFPSDWEITEEDVNGEKHWKASPPKKPESPSGEEPNLKEGFTSKKGNGRTNIYGADGKIVGWIANGKRYVRMTPDSKLANTLKDGEKAPWESDEPASPEGSGESSAPETPKEENTDWRKDGSREEAVATLSKVRDAAKAKAWDAYNQGEDTAEAQKKLQKALEKADADFDTKMALVDMKFPPPIDEHAEEDNPEGDVGEPEEPADGEDDEDSPAATMKDIEETFNAERERIEKALAKPNTKVRDKQKLREERKALKKRFTDAKAKFEGGGSAADMLDIFEPEEKPKGEGAAETTAEQAAEPSEEEQTQAEQQAQAQKDEQLRSTVREQKFYNSPGFKATAKLSPKELKQMENLLPAGWEFVTDNQFKAPARTKNGVVFIKHPTNGSYGRIFIKKDAKGKEYVQQEAQIDVDTTHPDYQGFVKNEDGTYGLTEEGKQVEKDFKRIRKYSDNEKERDEIAKKFNRIRFGHDEAPDNMSIVANAVAEALEKLG